MNLPNAKLILAGVALGGCVSLGYHLSQRGTVQPATAASVTFPKNQAPSTSKTATEQSLGAVEQPFPLAMSSKDVLVEMQPSRGGAAAPNFQNAREAQPSVELTHAELATRAAKVEKEATRELERLVPLLNLTQEQQDRVFDRLAQNSPDWHPSFQFSGGPQAAPVYANGLATTRTPAVETAPTPAPTAPTTTTQPVQPVLLPPVDNLPDLISPILNPDQEVTLLEDEAERREWWEEMLTVMQTNMDTANTPATPVEVPDKVVEGSETIVD